MSIKWLKFAHLAQVESQRCLLLHFQEPLVKYWLETFFSRATSEVLVGDNGGGWEPLLMVHIHVYNFTALPSAN